MVTLTPIQQLHYPTVRYLINDGPRAQGKTFLIAYAYLMEAAEHIGRKYSPVDFPNINFRSDRNILDVIKMIAVSMGIEIAIYKSTMEFSVLAVNPHVDVNYQIEGYK